MYSLSYYRVHFKFSCLEDMRLPEVKNSMFRGAFGRVFKSFNCANRNEHNCADCILKKLCAYNYIFEGKSEQQSSKPYVLFCPDVYARLYRKGETIPLELTLFGKSVAYVPHFILAFIEMGKIGIGALKYKYIVQEVTDDSGKIIFAGGKMVSQIQPETFCPPLPSKPVEKIGLRFIMPLRVTNFGDLVVEPSFETIVKALTRRLNALGTEYGALNEKIDYKTLIEKAKFVKTGENHLKWKDWTRFSNRQRNKMMFGGLVGDIVFEGDLTPFIPYLKLGQITHIGRNCVFGNGKYILTEEL